MSDWENAIRSELRNFRRVNGTSEFSLEDFQEFSRDRFEAQFPNNNTIDASIRRNLQEFRDRGELEFLGNGQYRISFDEQIQDEDTRVWIEKTNLEGREYKQQGDLRFIRL